jgi:hypothetical protein
MSLIALRIHRTAGRDAVDMVGDGRKEAHVKTFFHKVATIDSEPRLVRLLTYLERLPRPPNGYRRCPTRTARSYLLGQQI